MKTTQQLGEKPAKGLNSGILYLAFTPFAIADFVLYRWWKNNHEKFVGGDGGYVVMEDGASVSISRSRRQEFMELFSKF